MIKTLEPRTRLPLGNPNGYVLYDTRVKVEDQGTENVGWAFFIFDKQGRVMDVRQEILRGLGSAVRIISPLRDSPVRVFRSREIYYDLLYAFSDKGVDEDASWMHRKNPVFVRDACLREYMDDLAADRYARYISRRRGRK
ncbi:MAG: hypothetical protein PHH00_01000 [Candidatus Nanoarchaeia archaeon]|nr:hypothetical protein [Candidatus Nanoarchaeia archaeon]